MCARTCIFTIEQSSGVYKSMRRHGSSRWCVFDAFMRSHLAKQLCGSFKVLSAHRFLRHLWESGPIVERLDENLLDGRGTDCLSQRQKEENSAAALHTGNVDARCICVIAFV